MNRKYATFIWLAMGLLVATALGGCAQDVGTIDRSQHNIVKKSDLLGKEFYLRLTVVKAPFSSAYSTIGDQGRLERGIFEVQEDFLHFFRTYEWIENSEIIGAKADTDTPLLDANGEPVSYQACVDAAGRKMNPEACQNAELCPASAGCALQDVSVYVYRGAPLASFPIESHMDIVREYNPATGEKTNVISENTSDRMWNEREYMRVDWGTPSVINFSRLMMLGLRAQYPDVADWTPELVEADTGTSTEANLIKGFAIYKGEADSPRNRNRMVFKEGADGQPTVDYMDFVSYWVLPAPTTYYEYYDEYVPLCWFYPWYAGGVFECASEELTLRTAFLAVPESETYASRDYDDTQLDKFGFYRAERQHYDQDYGSTYSGQIQKAFLHPIWEASRDESGQTIPEAQRTPKPIVYYLSEGYPRELVDETLALAAQWSKPFEEIMTFYKGADWWQGTQFASADDASMFIICENADDVAQAAIDGGASFTATPGSTVNAVAHHGIEGQPGYSPYCADMSEPKYNGDLRYNVIHAVVEPQQNGLLGFGPPAADPLTGRIVNANAYLYLGTMKRYTHMMMDVIEVMSGVRGLHDYMTAEYVRKAMKGEAIQVESDDHNIGAEEAIGIASNVVSPQVNAAISTLGLEHSDMNWAQARMNLIRQKPALERMLVDDSVRMLFRDPSVGLDKPLDDAQVAKMSPRTWGNYRGFKRRLAYKLEAGNRSMDLLGFADPSISGIARSFGGRYDQAVCEHFRSEVVDGGRKDLIFDFDVFNDVKIDADTADGQCPEAGKTNAEGWTCEALDQGEYSGRYWVNTCTTKKLLDQIREQIVDDLATDPYAYWPQEWQWTDAEVPELANSQREMAAFLATTREELFEELYQKMFQAIATHEVGHNLGLRHNFTASTDALNYPREYWDLKAGITPEARASGATAFENGKYRPSLPSHMWQRETESQQYNNLRQLQMSSVMDYGTKFNSEFSGVGHYDMAAIKFGYGGLVEVFNQTPDLTPYMKYLASPRDRAPGNYGITYRATDDMEELFRRVHYTNLPNVFGSDDSAIDAMYDRANVRWDQVGQEQQEVPYRFAEYDRIGSDPWVWTRDSGADPFEIVINEIDDHENFDWFVYGYGHDSALFWPENYMNRVRMSFQMAKTQYQWWALNYAYFNHNDWWKNGPGRAAGPNGEDLAWHEDPNGGLSGTLAATEAFGLIAGAFGRPTPGYYGYNARTERFESILDYNPDNLTNAFRIYEDGGARPMYAGWSNWGYDIYPIRSGAIYDRMAAFETLTDPTTDFLGLDEAADTQRYKLSFYTMFPSETLHMLGGLLTGEVEGYGWCVDRDEFGNAKSVRRRNYLLGEMCGETEIALDPEPTNYIFPTTKYRMPMLAAYYGMSLLISDYDRSFMDVTRVFLKGHRTAVSLPDDVESVEFSHPLSGKVYVAYKSGYDNEYEPAYYLVQRANEELANYTKPDGSIDLARLVDDYPRSELEFITGKLELVRAMHALYDYTEFGEHASSGQ